jgi:hypothetical protein
MEKKEKKKKKKKWKTKGGKMPRRVPGAKKGRKKRSSEVGKVVQRCKKRSCGF